MQQKRETFIYEGLGFPVRLMNVPMKEIFGEWVIDINFNQLQIAALHMLAMKPTALTGGEIRFIVDYLRMPTREFAKVFGVSHAAVLKWINEKSKMSFSSEVCLRLYLLDYLHVSDKEFKLAYSKVTPENLMHSDAGASPLEIDATKNRMLICRRRDIAHV